MNFFIKCLISFLMIFKKNCCCVNYCFLIFCYSVFYETPKIFFQFVIYFILLENHLMLKRFKSLPSLLILKFYFPMKTILTIMLLYSILYSIFYFFFPLKEIKSSIFFLPIFHFNFLRQLFTFYKNLLNNVCNCRSF